MTESVVPGPAVAESLLINHFFTTGLSDQQEQVSLACNAAAMHSFKCVTVIYKKPTDHHLTVAVRGTQTHQISFTRLFSQLST